MNRRLQRQSGGAVAAVAVLALGMIFASPAARAGGLHGTWYKQTTTYRGTAVSPGPALTLSAAPMYSLAPAATAYQYQAVPMAAYQYQMAAPSASVYQYQAAAAPAYSYGYVPISLAPFPQAPANVAAFALSMPGMRPASASGQAAGYGFGMAPGAAFDPVAASMALPALSAAVGGNPQLLGRLQDQLFKAAQGNLGELQADGPNRARVVAILEWAAKFALTTITGTDNPLTDPNIAADISKLVLNVIQRVLGGNVAPNPSPVNPNPSPVVPLASDAIRLEIPNLNIYLHQAPANDPAVATPVPAAAPPPPSANGPST